jgi:hypothetical protein
VPSSRGFNDPAGCRFAVFLTSVYALVNYPGEVHQCLGPIVLLCSSTAPVPKLDAFSSLPIYIVCDINSDVRL